MVSLLSTCLKYLPIAPLSMIMDCDFALPKSRTARFLQKQFCIQQSKNLE